MVIENKALVLDLLEWIGDDARPYREVMDAWRTSCPRLPIWEDALESELIALHRRDGAGVVVCVTDAGARLLRSERRGANSSIRS